MNFLINLLQIVSIFILPVLLVQKNLISKRFRLTILFSIIFVVGLIVYFEKWSLTQLGIRVDNLIQGILPYSLFTISGVIGIILAAKYFKKKVCSTWWKYSHFQYLFILLSVSQEFLYRGFLMPKLAAIIPSALGVILVNSLIFMYLHIIYPNKLTNLSLTLIAGLGFAAIYYYFPNLILISISHSILNFFAVLYHLVGFGEKFHHDSK